MSEPNYKATPTTEEVNAFRAGKLKVGSYTLEPDGSPEQITHSVPAPRESAPTKTRHVEAKPSGAAYETRAAKPKGDKADDPKK